jgi:hypothetical protein
VEKGFIVEVKEEASLKEEHEAATAVQTLLTR